MIVVDLRGQDRASGAIPGTAHIPAMDLLKETGSYVEKFRHQPIVAFFCQYSAHRAPTVAGCICSIFLQYTVSVFGLDWFTMVYHWFTTLQKHSRATFSGGENQSNKVANFFRKSCPSKQRVVVLEGGFRGWEAHDLPIQQMETTMSQMACDQLALKIGKDVSKVN